METTSIPDHLIRVPQHGSYLQGMETTHESINHLVAIVMHGSYLQGMETFKIAYVLGKMGMHGSYLQGMETQHALPPSSPEARARILPTRNGNYRCHETIGEKGRSTDPTYKEWKPLEPA